MGIQLFERMLVILIVRILAAVLVSLFPNIVVTGSEPNAPFGTKTMATDGTWLPVPLVCLILDLWRA
ncbi:MAG: hypothetical protein JW828_00855 [Sedimentisphaerales bacterium]|nr:hypothetical protein [Sedimentisphaerales bacterium]